MSVAGVILAGGRSSRMEGRDKALLPLRAKPLLRWAVDRLAPQVDGLAVNTNGEPALFRSFGYEVVADTLPGHAGPLAGVLAGLEWAAPAHEAVVTVAVDTPFFSEDLVARLGAGSACKVAASDGRTHPVFAIWPVALVEPLRSFLADSGTGRVMSFLNLAGAQAVDFPFRALPSGPLDPFFNINTPADLARAEIFAQEMA